jgi:hypothetical protein
LRLCKICNKPLSFFSGYIPLKGELCVDCYNHELSLDALKEAGKNHRKST